MMRDCTCLGTCRGKEGLGANWRCALEPLSTLEWARERLANSERIADQKTGADRASWLEDVRYWRDIVRRLQAFPATLTPSQAQGDPR